MTVIFRFFPMICQRSMSVAVLCFCYPIAQAIVEIVVAVRQALRNVRAHTHVAKFVAIVLLASHHLVFTSINTPYVRSRSAPRSSTSHLTCHSIHSTCHSTSDSGSDLQLSKKLENEKQWPKINAKPSCAIFSYTISLINL